MAELRRETDNTYKRQRLAKLSLSVRPSGFALEAAVGSPS